ncbi:DoxX family protein [Flavobacterium psychrotrophum]|uniref:DoxX family protein n=1 Tax=Flavobacterium psychrotrophum TaxID=2294119 RepID=UPI000E31F08C|nr:DoxX family protein [Flavobacterium psychrotrophum]
METNLNPVIIITLAFFAITFIQSGYDKIMDWKGNIGWLKGHFAATPIKNMVPLSLMLILVLEILAGAFAVIGIIKIWMDEGTEFAFYAGVLSAITLLFLLLGQRLAKDYDGARTIVIYFIPAILLLTWV